MPTTANLIEALFTFIPPSYHQFSHPKRQAAFVRKLVALTKIKVGLRCDMTGTILWQKLGLALGAIALLASAAAQAENLDQGKSGARLFADSCVACHRSARGLAKGRFSLTLFLFLQKNYASNSSSA